MNDIERREPEPAQAAPSEIEGDEEETIDRFPKSWIAWKREAERLEAALASERTKREDASAGPFAGFAEEVFARGLKDKTAKEITSSPAPDAAALRARVLVACIETESALARHEVEHGDGWLYNHADVIRGYKTELEALLRSEPRGESK